MKSSEDTFEKINKLILLNRETFEKGKQWHIINYFE
jgi:hypothetical protein